MGYISLISYDIPELVIPIMIALIEDCYCFESFTVAAITWLTVTEYLCHKKCSICRFHNLFLSSFIHVLSSGLYLEYHDGCH